jgi:hypothetical protein
MSKNNAIITLAKELASYIEEKSALEDYLIDQIDFHSNQVSEAGKGNPMPEDISQEDLINRCYVDAYSCIRNNFFG